MALPLARTKPAFCLTKSLQNSQKSLGQCNVSGYVVHNMNPQRLLLLASIVAITSPLAHSDTAVTDPVGFQATSIPVGMSTLANPLVNADVVRSAASANTSSNVTFSGVTNFATLLTANEPYYIEVVSGALEGERYDVDTSATIASANSVVTIATSSANNTSPLVAGSLTNNTTLALRRHITIEQIGGYFSPALIGNNNVNSADMISLYDSTGRSLVNYFLRGDNVTWRQQGTTTTVNKLPIPSGTGFFITKRSVPTTFTSVGSVRNNDYAFPMAAGSSFRAPGFPVNYSPAGSSGASLGGVGANGWTGNNNVNLADQLQVWDRTGGSFITYFLRGDGITWRQQGTTTTVTSQDLFANNNGFMVLKRANDLNYILVNPIVQ
jgi:hypothetical protein